MSFLYNRQLVQCITFILIIAWSGPLAAQADEMTVYEWLEKIKETSPIEEQIAAKYLVANVLIGWNGKSHCKPHKANVGQAVAIAQKYLKDAPELWHESAANSIGAVLGIVWPCDKLREEK